MSEARTFPPDSAAVAALRPSPNRGERRGDQGPDILVLHYTGMTGADAALERLCDPESSVSAHYVVLEDGRVLQLVPEACRAWHAGRGTWQGVADVNSRSVGIEIVHPGHAGGLPPYPDAQVAGVIALAGDVVRRLGIRPDRVIAHSDMAPDRKEDPGEVFPWERLHRAGIGHWVPPHPPGDPVMGRGASGPDVAALLRDLRDYGYPVAEGDMLDDGASEVVRAFQRHFRPARVDGEVDRSTLATLRDLLRARPSSDR